MKRIAAPLFLCAAGFSVSAMAEIEKNARLKCDTGICLYQWPKLPTPQGWHQDKDASYNASANVLVPVGESFGRAQAVIYANAIHKPSVPSEKTRDAYIESDLLSFRKHDPTLVVAHLPSQKTADGQLLEVYSFSPVGPKGRWEVVAYGEEGEFYLTFVVSAKNEKALNIALPVFYKLVSLYQEKPQPLVEGRRP